MLTIAGLFLASHFAALSILHVSAGVSAVFVLCAASPPAAACFWSSTEALVQCGASGIFWPARCPYGRSVRRSTCCVLRCHPCNIFTSWAGILLSRSTASRCCSRFPPQTKTATRRSSCVIDSFQAVFAVVLVYIELLLSQSGTGASTEPANLSLIYGFGGWMLAGAALLRVLARPSGEEKALYRILLVYLCLFALLATPLRGSSVFNTLRLGIYRDLLARCCFPAADRPGVCSIFQSRRPTGRRSRPTPSRWC